MKTEVPCYDTSTESVPMSSIIHEADDQSEENSSDAKIEALVTFSLSNRIQNENNNKEADEKEEGELVEEGEILSSDSEEKATHKSSSNEKIEKISRKRSGSNISSTNEKESVSNFGFQGELPTADKGKKRKIDPIIYDVLGSENGLGNHESYNDGYLPMKHAYVSQYSYVSQIDESVEQLSQESSDFDDLRERLVRKHALQHNKINMQPQTQPKYTYLKRRLKCDNDDSSSEGEIQERLSSKVKNRRRNSEPRSEIVKLKSQVNRKFTFPKGKLIHSSLDGEIKDDDLKVSTKVSSKNSKKDKKKKDKRCESTESESRSSSVDSKSKKFRKKMSKKKAKLKKKLDKLQTEEPSANCCENVENELDKSLSVKVLQYDRVFSDKTEKTKSAVSHKPTTPSPRKTGILTSSNTISIGEKKPSASDTLTDFSVQNGWANLDFLMQQFVDYQFKALQEQQEKPIHSPVGPSSKTANVEMEISPNGAASAFENHQKTETYFNSKTSYCEFDNQYLKSQYRSSSDNEQDSLLVEPKSASFSQNHQLKNRESLYHCGLASFVNEENLTVLTDQESKRESNPKVCLNSHETVSSADKAPCLDVDKELDIFLETARNQSEIKNAPSSLDAYIRQEKQKTRAAKHRKEEHQKLPESERQCPKKPVPVQYSLKHTHMNPNHVVETEQRRLSLSDQFRQQRAQTTSPNIAITLDMPEFISPVQNTAHMFEDDVFLRETYGRSNAKSTEANWVPEPVEIFSEEEVASFRNSSIEQESCNESFETPTKTQVDQTTTIPQVVANYKIAKACFKTPLEVNATECDSNSGFESLTISPQKQFYDSAKVASQPNWFPAPSDKALNEPLEDEINNLNTDKIEIPENIKSLFAKNQVSQNDLIASSSVDILSNLNSKFAKHGDELNESFESAETESDSKDEVKGTYEPFLRNLKIKKFADEQISLSGLPDPRLLASNRKLRASSFAKYFKRMKRWNKDSVIERSRRPLRNIKPIKLLDGDFDSTPLPPYEKLDSNTTSVLAQNDSVEVHGMSHDYAQANNHKSKQRSPRVREPELKIVAFDNFGETPVLDPRLYCQVVVMRMLVNDFMPVEFTIDVFSEKETKSNQVLSSLSLNVVSNSNILGDQALGSQLLQPNHFDPFSFSPPPNLSKDISPPMPASVVTLADPRIRSGRVTNPPVMPVQLHGDPSNTTKLREPIFNQDRMPELEVAQMATADIDYRTLPRGTILSSYPQFSGPRHICAPSINPKLRPNHPMFRVPIAKTECVMPNRDVDMRIMNQSDVATHQTSSIVTMNQQGNAHSSSRNKDQPILALPSNDSEADRFQPTNNLGPIMFSSNKQKPELSNTRANVSRTQSMPRKLSNYNPASNNKIIESADCQNRAKPPGRANNFNPMTPEIEFSTSSYTVGTVSEHWDEPEMCTAKPSPEIKKPKKNPLKPEFD